MRKRETHILESDVKDDIIGAIKEMYPDCFVLKNDSGYLQGVPDWVILYKDKWVMLELKKSKTASHQPNQDYYVDILNRMSYATFAYPENKEEVLHDIQQTFGA